MSNFPVDLSLSPAELLQYRNEPALAPPPGVVPNFMVHNYRADLYIGLCSTLLGFTCMFVLLRLYAKIWINRNPGLDDVTCVLATLGVAASIGLNTHAVLRGVGKHQWDIPLLEVVPILSFGRYNAIVIQPSAFLIKLTLLLLYLRIFRPDKITRYLIYAGIAICFTAYATLMFLNIFVNTHVSVDDSIATGGVNLASDVYILCVPIAAVSKLQLSLKRKLGIMMVFLTGILACIISCVSLAYRLKIRVEDSDITYILSMTDLVTTVELLVGVMCACMPFLPAIIVTLRKRFYSAQRLKSRSSARDPAENTRASRSYTGADEEDDCVELQDYYSSKEQTLVGSPKETSKGDLESCTERSGSEAETIGARGSGM